MSAAKIPEEISSHKPGKCTVVKLINGHYYVYMYKAVRLDSGRWSSKTGKCIGSIIPGTGFKANRNYHLFTGQAPDDGDGITVIEYGQYALVDFVARDILSRLRAHFPEERARQIFSYAAILYANDFVHLDQVQSYYEQSWLAVECAGHTFRMGRAALGGLLQELGTRTARVTAYENSMIESSSLKMAIDGHAIRSCSDENDLAEAGAKFSALNEDQVNLLMGYDIVSGMPLFARMYRGSCHDSSTVADLAGLLDFRGVLFVVDRGFYGEDNLRLMSANGNNYIVPVPRRTKIFEAAMSGGGCTGEFCHCSSSRRSRVEYREAAMSGEDGGRLSVFVFRDVDEAERTRFNYLHCLELGKPGYSREGYEAQKDNFGVYVLRTGGGMPPEEVFGNYKRRWGIETFYQYVRNVGDYNNLMVQDYYKEQGLAFVMLVAGQIHQKMIEAVGKLGCSTISTRDILLMARRMKMERRESVWLLKNTRSRDLELLSKLGFSPQDRYPASVP